MKNKTKYLFAGNKWKENALLNLLYSSNAFSNLLVTNVLSLYFSAPEHAELVNLLVSYGQNPVSVGYQSEEERRISSSAPIHTHSSNLSTLSLLESILISGKS